MNEERRCKAKSSRTGAPCKRAANLGGRVCNSHGGRAPQVRRKAAERLADLIDPDRALREAARLAYSDVTELFDDKGQMRPMKQWPAELAAAVGAVEVVRRNVDSGDGHQDDVIKIKLWDKSKNLEMLFKYLGLLTERMEIKVEGDIEARLIEGRNRVAKAK